LLGSIESKIQGSRARPRTDFRSAASSTPLGLWTHKMWQRLPGGTNEREVEPTRRNGVVNVTGDRKFLPVQDSTDVAAVGEGQERRPVPRLHGAGRPVVEVALLSSHRQIVLPRFRHHRHDSLDSVIVISSVLLEDRDTKLRN